MFSILLGPRSELDFIRADLHRFDPLCLLSSVHTAFVRHFFNEGKKKRFGSIQAFTTHTALYTNSHAGTSAV